MFTWHDKSSEEKNLHVWDLYLFTAQLSAVQLICVLCVYGTVCHCFITGNHLIAWRTVNWVALRLALALLKILDTVLVSFCKTVIGAPLDIMQGHNSALGHLNLDLKPNRHKKSVQRSEEQVHSDCELVSLLVLVKGNFNLRKWAWFRYLKPKLHMNISLIYQWNELKKNIYLTLMCSVDFIDKYNID